MHFKTILRTLLTVILLTPPLLVAQKRFPGIKTLMTDEEMEASDVNDLSRRHLNALNIRLIRYTPSEAPVP